MRTAIGAVLLTILILSAGCASPTETEEAGEPEESPSPTDNEAGAEPVNPNASNGTEDPGTLNPPADNETAGDNETGGGNETAGDETDTIATTA